MAGKLFYTKSHSVLQLVHSNGPKHLFRLSFADWILERCGDPVLIKSHVASGSMVGAEEILCKMDWEGYTITTADELYHTVWDNTDGCLDLVAPPFASRVTAFNDELVQGDTPPTEIDESDWLVELELCDEGMAQLAAAVKVGQVFPSEAEYQIHAEAAAAVE
jgi:hypothetical protein